MGRPSSVAPSCVADRRRWCRQLRHILTPPPLEHDAPFFVTSKIGAPFILYLITPAFQIPFLAAGRGNSTRHHCLQYPHRHSARSSSFATLLKCRCTCLLMPEGLVTRDIIDDFDYILVHVTTRHFAPDATADRLGIIIASRLYCQQTRKYTVRPATQLTILLFA